MKLKTFLSTIVLIGFSGLVACETVPNAEKAKMYDAAMRSKFIGKSFDEVVLAYGPPNSNYQMNDGRIMYQYNFSQKSVYAPGGTIQYGGYYGARYSGLGFGFGFPFGLSTGASEFKRDCTRRFLVNSAKIVEDFKFEGNSCF